MLSLKATSVPEPCMVGSHGLLDVRVICNFAVDYCPHSSVLTILSSNTFQFDNIFYPLISSF